jgi:hypothetical protein
MGFFSKVAHVVSDAGRQVADAGRKVGNQLSTNIKHLPEVAAQVGAVGAFPVTAAIGSIAPVLTAAAPVLGQATQMIHSNPLLGQALGSMVPGLGGLFSGGAPAAAPGGGGIITEMAAQPQTERPGVPVWVWIAAAGAAVLGLFFLLRRKA